MRCKSSESHRLLFWVTIAIAIFPANLPGQERDGTGSRFVVERRGLVGGRPVVFIPGLASAGAVWDTAAASIVDKHDLHIVTLAGFAGVPAVDPIGPYFEPAVAALADYLDEEGLQDVVLVGHSMGAQIALQVAASRPDAVGKVLVVESAPFYAALFNPTVTPEAAARYGAQLGTRLASMPLEQFLAFARQGIAVQSITEFGQERVMGYMAASDQAAVAQAMGEVAGSDFRPLLAKVRAPVTVLAAWSEGAPYSSDQLRAIYEGQYAGLADVDVRIIADSRHFIMMDRPEAFARALSEVLIGDGQGSDR